EQRRDLRLAGAKELFWIPAVISFRWIAQDGREWIRPSQGLPGLAQVFDCHSTSLGNSGDVEVGVPALQPLARLCSQPTVGSPGRIEIGSRGVGLVPRREDRVAHAPI